MFIGESDCWLTSTQQFFSYIMATTSKFSKCDIYILEPYK